MRFHAGLAPPVVKDVTIEGRPPSTWEGTFGEWVQWQRDNGQTILAVDTERGTILMKQEKFDG